MQLPQLVQRYGLPVNAITRPRDAEFITPIFQDINREIRRQEPHWDDLVSLLVESLFLHLSRQLDSAGLIRAEEARVEGFRRVRMQIHERLQEPWTVAAMARLVNLSRAHFASLYTKLFGVSPIEDLIDARLRCARALLSNVGMSVASVAERSGFGSVCHFSRIFRKHVGCAPRDYRRYPLAIRAGGVDTASEPSEQLMWVQHRSSVTDGWELERAGDLPKSLRAAQEEAESQSTSTPIKRGNDSRQKRGR